jgi:hypothetical protein
LIWCWNVSILFTEESWVTKVNRCYVHVSLPRLCKNFKRSPLNWMSYSTLYIIELPEYSWNTAHWALINNKSINLDTTLCDKVCQWLATSQLFSPGIPVSSTNKTDRHHISEIDCSSMTLVLNPQGQNHKDVPWISKQLLKLS